MGQNSDKSLVETIPDTDAADPETWLQNTNLIGRLDDWLEALPEKHSEVLVRRFGLHGHEIQYAGRGRARDRPDPVNGCAQIQVEALRRLREIVENNGLTGVDLLES